jgi:hypothetical protein
LRSAQARRRRMPAPMPATRGSRSPRVPPSWGGSGAGTMGKFPLFRVGMEQRTGCGVVEVTSRGTVRSTQGTGPGLAEVIAMDDGAGGRRATVRRVGMASSRRRPHRDPGWAAPVPPRARVRRPRRTRPPQTARPTRSRRCSSRGRRCTPCRRRSRSRRSYRRCTPPSRRTYGGRRSPPASRPRAARRLGRRERERLRRSNWVASTAGPPRSPRRLPPPGHHGAPRGHGSGENSPLCRSRHGYRGRRDGTGVRRGGRDGRRRLRYVRSLALGRAQGEPALGVTAY